MDAPQGRAPNQPGAPPILMPSAHVPLKEHAHRARRRRQEAAIALVLLAFAAAAVATIW